MSKREFLMLAEEYATKHDIGGWFMSEKCDGQRAFWDGGVSRGLDAREVPYMNVAKDGRYKERPICTGLISRYGKVIAAPSWWLDALPVGPTLDMELWCGRGTFQAMRSIVGSLDKGEGWRKVVGHIIDSPSWDAVLSDGELTGANWKGYLDRSMVQWVAQRASVDGGASMVGAGYHRGFGQPDECFRTLGKLWESMGQPASWRPMAQTRLPRDLAEAREVVARELQAVSSQGGEGLILRSPTSPWIPKRVNWVLKVKKLNDAEGTVTGFTWGRRTDKMSRHLGRMGALVVVAHTGVRLELSGFTDEERSVELAPGGDLASYMTMPIEVTDDSGTREELRTVPIESVQREGKDASSAFQATHFPVGSKVTYTYRDLSVDRVPKEARYLRKRGAE